MAARPRGASGGWSLIDCFRVIRAVLLQPGDALFIPCNWWHATLNVGETVAVGGQHESRRRQPGDDADKPAPCSHDIFNDAELRMKHATSITARAPAEAAELLGQAAAVMEYHVQCATQRFEAEARCVWLLVQDSTCIRFFSILLGD
eukprot:SAG22_NODE_6003_length_917_cov_1.407090_2_plen_147_part_00